MSGTTRRVVETGGISRDEWLATIHQADGPNDPDALTSAELGALIGFRSSATKARLAKLIDAGKVRRTYKRITDRAGRTQTVTAYRLVTAPEPAKRRHAKKA